MSSIIVINFNCTVVQDCLDLDLDKILHSTRDYYFATDTDETARET